MVAGTPRAPEPPPREPDRLAQLGDQIVELFQALVVDGERAAFAVEGDLGLEAELGGEVAFQRLGVGVIFARLCDDRVTVSPTSRRPSRQYTGDVGRS